MDARVKPAHDDHSKRAAALIPSLPGLTRQSISQKYAEQDARPSIDARAVARRHQGRCSAAPISA